MHLRIYAVVEKSIVGPSKSIFLTLRWHQCVSMGVEVWGGSIPKSTWKEFENIQKYFFKSRNKHHTISYF